VSDEADRREYVSELSRDLATALNRNGVDSRLCVPDFVLAEYLVDCLKSFVRLTINNEQWHDGDPPEYVLVGSL
jgi:hypothetical protein